MPNGSSRVRRQLRAHYWGLTRINSNLRGIHPVAVGVTVHGVFGLRYLGGMNALEGAEKSCRKRRSRRGQRTGKSRSRDQQSRSPQTVRPKPTNEMSDRKVNRALKQLDYWKARERSIIDRLKRLGADHFFVELVTPSLKTYLSPHFTYTACRASYHRLQSMLKKGPVWCRPLACKWSVMINTYFGFNPGGEVPRWICKSGMGDFVEFMKDCRDLEVHPDYRTWGAYLSVPHGSVAAQFKERQRAKAKYKPSATDKRRGKTRRVEPSGPSSQEAPSRLTGPKGKGKLIIPKHQLAWCGNCRQVTARNGSFSCSRCR